MPREKEGQKWRELAGVCATRTLRLVAYSCESTEDYEYCRGGLNTRQLLAPFKVERLVP